MFPSRCFRQKPYLEEAVFFEARGQPRVALGGEEIVLGDDAQRDRPTTLLVVIWYLY